MKPCFEFTQWRRQTLERTLTSAETAVFAAHCRSCPACLRASGQARRIDDWLRQSAQRRAPEGFNQGVWDRIQALPSAVGLRRSWLPAWSAAGLLAALTVAGFAAYSAWHPQSAGKATEVVRLPESGALIPAPTAAAAQATSAPAAQRAETLVSRKAVHPPRHIRAEKEAVETTSKFALMTSKRRPALPEPPHASRAESFAPAVREGGGALAEPARAAAGLGNGAPAGSLLRLLPGSVQVRPNTIHPTRGERILLEVNPETPGHLEARIYTREGRLVRTLVDTDIAPGYHAWDWDGTNDRQENVSGGIFILQVRGNVPDRKFKLAVIR
ncbi:MAG: hypothetical protein HGA76_01095 [Candidatus Firestonebacteria bacterium]|nr:hypothetical protein [Candidatus Firestonebacteria bacterium]